MAVMTLCVCCVYERRSSSTVLDKGETVVMSFFLSPLTDEQSAEGERGGTKGKMCRRVEAGEAH